MRVTNETDKKRQSRHNDQEKIKKTKPSKDFFNQYVSQTDVYDSKFDRKSKSVQSLKSEMNLPLHQQINNIIYSNFTS